MKVLVTGGCGFIGSHIVDILVENDMEVFVFDDLSSGSIENLNEKAKLFTGDIRSRTEIDGLFRVVVPDAVIHHAAQIDVQSSMKNPAYDASVNIQGTVDLLDICSRYGTGRFIYASSAAIYGNPEYLGIDEEHPKNPESFYGYSKLVPETYIRMMSGTRGISHAILRYSNVYGPRQNAGGEGGVVAIFADAMERNANCTIFGDGKQTRDFVYVRDVARANLLALQTDDNMTLNISTGIETTVNGLFEIMKKTYRYEKNPLYAPARPGEISRSWLSNEKAESIMGWKPEYSVVSGMEDMKESND